MVLAYFSCCYHASRYHARARTRAPKRCLLKGCFGARARAVPRHNNNNNNNNKDSKNHQQQQSWLVPWAIAGFAGPINIQMNSILIYQSFNISLGLWIE